MKRLISFVLAATFMSASAFAVDGTGNAADPANTNNAPGSTTSDHMGMSQDTSVSSSAATASAQKDEKDYQTAHKDALKANLGPQAISIQTNLASAIEQVKGLKTQLDSSQDLKVDNSRWFKLNSHQLNNDVAMASKLESNIQTKLQSYPSVAQSDDFKSFNNAFATVKTLNQSWQAQAATQSYWKNMTQAKNDLNTFQKRLETALDKAKSFSSGQLDVNTVS